MQEITRDEYISNIVDYEKTHLIITTDYAVYLRADIDTGGDIGLRLEYMYFEMDTSLPFNESNSDSRNCGRSIYFDEYGSFEEAEQEAIKDFLYICEDAIYLMCEENDLKDILPKYKNKSIYVVTV